MKGLRLGVVSESVGASLRGRPILLLGESRFQLIMPRWGVHGGTPLQIRTPFDKAWSCVGVAACYKVLGTVQSFSSSSIVSPLKLPMSSPSPEALSLSTSVTSKAESRVLILVVERNPIVQRLERYFLEHAGFEVEFACDGVSALERVRELKPQILVTEILVPKLDGLSLCRILKSEPETREIQVLVFSHLHAEDRAREVMADAFLLKPLNEQLLIETVENLIALRPQSVGVIRDS